MTEATATYQDHVRAGMLRRLYQWCISPFLGTCCRYEPTCSHYAAQSIEYHGIMKGGMLTAWRLLRCNPFGGSGYDPVPPADQKK